MNERIISQMLQAQVQFFIYLFFIFYFFIFFIFLRSLHFEKFFKVKCNPTNKKSQPQQQVLNLGCLNKTVNVQLKQRMCDHLVYAFGKQFIHLLGSMGFIWFYVVAADRVFKVYWAELADDPRYHRSLTRHILGLVDSHVTSRV